MKHSSLLLGAVLALCACTENYYYTTDALRAEAGAAGARGEIDGSEASQGEDATVALPMREDAGRPEAVDASASMDGATASTTDTGTGSMMDAGRTPTQDAEASEDDPSSVHITVPGPAIERVTGKINIQIAVEGAPADRVDLYQDGSLLASLVLPYQFSWDTSEVSEGSHTLMVRAVRRREVVSERSRVLIVDRTPPTLLRMIPASGSKELPLSQPLEFHFSEPISVDSVASALRVEVLGRAQPFTSSVGADRQSIRVQLAAPAPTLPATATITLTTSLHDLAGVALAQTVQSVASFYAWRQLGPTIASAGEVVALESNGSALWALLERYDSATRTRSLRAAEWKSSVEEWEITDRLSPPSSVYRSGYGDTPYTQLAVDASGAPIVYAVRNPEPRLFERREKDGTWASLPTPPGYETGWVEDIEAEPNGGLLMALSQDGNVTVHRLSGDAWSQVGEKVPGYRAKLSTGESGVFLLTNCNVSKEGPLGWVSLGRVQTTAGCTAAELFQRPGSRVGAFVTATVTTNNTTTTTYAVLEHVAGTKWLAPTFGVPTLARSAARSGDAFVFMARDERSFYDARAEPMVRDMPIQTGPLAVAVYKGAPAITTALNTSYLSPPAPPALQVLLLNHFE